MPVYQTELPCDANILFRSTTTKKKEIGFHFLSNGTKKDVISKLITFELKQLMIQYFI